MSDKGIVQGTTPTLRITTKTDDVDFTAFKAVEVYIGQLERLVLTKRSGQSGIVIAPQEIDIYLTQEETLKLMPGNIGVEVRVLSDSGSAFASGRKYVAVGKLYSKAVIE